MRLLFDIRFSRGAAGKRGADTRQFAQVAEAFDSLIGRRFSNGPQTGQR